MQDHFLVDPISVVVPSCGGAIFSECSVTLAVSLAVSLDVSLAVSLDVSLAVSLAMVLLVSQTVSDATEAGFCPPAEAGAPALK